MNRFRRHIAMAALASFISVGNAMTSMASTKVAKNTAAWVEEARKQEEEAKATEEAKAAKEAAAAVAVETTTAQKTSVRQQIVDYAFSFVGGRYIWGGMDPHSSADCSGFTRYILSRTGGVSISRSSAEQAGEDRTVATGSMQPGGLLFYSKGSDVNHTAIYIGNDQMVHAFSSKIGIIVSARDYRTPMYITSYLN